MFFKEKQMQGARDVKNVENQKDPKKNSKRKSENKRKKDTENRKNQYIPTESRKGPPLTPPLYTSVRCARMPN